MLTSPVNVVIAGVGPGLGVALARKFAHHGCTVGLLARSQNYLNQLVNEFSANEQTAIALPADLPDGGWQTQWRENYGHKGFMSLTSLLMV